MLRLVVAGLIAISVFAACSSNDDGRGGEIQTFPVEGASMQPTFENGTRLELHAYVDDLPQRGDIIVFSAPTSTHRDFLKRVIGLPGDAISIDEELGVVSVNGELLAEPYIQGVTSCGAACEVAVPQSDATRLPQLSPQGFAPRADYGPACRATACYFVMGDNRQNSSDSRQGWLVPAENIVGWVEER